MCVWTPLPWMLRGISYKYARQSSRIGTAMPEGEVGSLGLALTSKVQYSLPELFSCLAA